MALTFVGNATQDKLQAHRYAVVRLQGYCYGGLTPPCGLRAIHEMPVLGERALLARATLAKSRGEGGQHILY
eukprot:6188519-Pleurochrysis_carterae.AAC.5